MVHTRPVRFIAFHRQLIYSRISSLSWWQTCICRADRSICSDSLSYTLIVFIVVAPLSGSDSHRQPNWHIGFEPIPPNLSNSYNADLNRLTRYAPIYINAYVPEHNGLSRRREGIVPHNSPSYDLLPYCRLRLPPQSGNATPLFQTSSTYDSVNHRLCSRITSASNSAAPYLGSCVLTWIAASTSTLLS